MWERLQFIDLSEEQGKAGRAAELSFLLTLPVLAFELEAHRAQAILQLFSPTPPL